MKISLITVVYNGERFIRDCIESVLAQDYKQIEYIFIDGASKDNTFKIAQEYKNRIDILISEPDKGMYDALNKGIKLATGDVVGILNADDMLADSNVISQVIAGFELENSDAIYGDLNYIHPQSLKTIRKWKSKVASANDIEMGWMPAHPTLYIKRALFEQYGFYSLNFGSAADYELMVRYLYRHQIKTTYLPLLMVNMRTGGMSNSTIKHRYDALINDYEALKVNGVPLPARALVLKKLQKLKQFF